MLLGDGITGMSNSLPCKLLSSSSPFGQKFSLINLSRHLGISSVVLSSVHQSGLELAQVLLKGIGMMPRFCMEKEDAVRRCSERSLRQTCPKAWTTISRIHFVHILLAGELEVARTVDLLHLLMVRNGHILSTQLRDLPCRHLPSPGSTDPPAALLLLLFPSLALI